MNAKARRNLRFSSCKKTINTDRVSLGYHHVMIQLSFDALRRRLRSVGKTNPEGLTCSFSHERQKAAAAKKSYQTVYKLIWKRQSKIHDCLNVRLKSYVICRWGVGVYVRFAGTLCIPFAATLDVCTRVSTLLLLETLPRRSDCVDNFGTPSARSCRFPESGSFELHP